MTSNEKRILKIIWDKGGETSLDTIAREAGMSIDYTRLICESLGREDFINFSHTKLCKIMSKGKRVIAKRQRSFKKILTSRTESKSGSDKEKKGRLILHYG